MSILGQPEYVHILLHPLPVLGLAVAVLGLVLGLVFKGQGTVAISLVLVALTAGSAFFVYQLGESAEDRVEDNLDKESKAWVHEHEERAETAIYLFYVTAFVALAAMAMRPMFPGFARGATWATLVLACLSILAGSWIGYAGGRISHPELREGPAPLQVESEAAGHTEEI